MLNVNAQIVFNLTPRLMDEDTERLLRSGESLVLEHIASCHNALLEMKHGLQHAHLTIEELQAAGDELRAHLADSEAAVDRFRKALERIAGMDNDDFTTTDMAGWASAALLPATQTGGS